ncbi:hypothetical protein L7V33_28130, partial [Klebsiella pneumoniae]|nr:hypothetical protein [Klebsiella pneumoniae]
YKVGQFLDLSRNFCYNECMEVIQSKQNASIKTARKLLQRKHRKTSYLIEGWHLFEEAKASGAHILQIFVLEEMADRVANMSKGWWVSPEVDMVCGEVQWLQRTVSCTHVKLLTKKRI